MMCVLDPTGAACTLGSVSARSRLGARR